MYWWWFCKRIENFTIKYSNFILFIYLNIGYNKMNLFGLSFILFISLFILELSDWNFLGIFIFVCVKIRNQRVGLNFFFFFTFLHASMRREGTILIPFYTISTQSQTFKNLFVALHLRLLPSVINHSARNCKAFAQWDLLNSGISNFSWFVECRSNLLKINVFNILTKILINIYILEKTQDPTL